MMMLIYREDMMMLIYREEINMVMIEHVLGHKMIDTTLAVAMENMIGEENGYGDRVYETAQEVTPTALVLLEPCTYKNTKR